MTISPRIAVRALARSDIAGLQRIDECAHGESWSRRTFLDQIADPSFRHLVATAAAGAPLVGHAASWRDRSVLRIINVAVAEQWQGSGVASHLLGELLVGLAGLESIQLEVRPANRSAQRLYGRFGFAPVGLVRGFYDRRDERGGRDALIMMLDRDDFDRVEARRGELALRCADGMVP